MTSEEPVQACVHATCAILEVPLNMTMFANPCTYALAFLGVQHYSLYHVNKKKITAQKV